MDLNKLSKSDLFAKCEEYGITKYKSKNKLELIQLIESHNKKDIQIQPDNILNTQPDNILNTQPEIISVDNNIISDQYNNNIEVKNICGLEYLKTINDNSIDLVLTDPPYIISRDSGMNAHYNKVAYNAENNIEFIKTEEEWIKYKTEYNNSEENKLKNAVLSDNKKDNYMRYGTIYGRKYCVKTDYGDWDSNFTIDKLEQFISEYYKKLKQGGTLIIFFDLWKITLLKDILEKFNFKQIRFIEWIKTNPQPLNSSTNYLTNCREIALLGIKGAKPIFNSKYDNGLYMYPLQGGKNRFHPTQKSLILFEELIKKHSNPNEVVLDTFLGGGTTAIACKNTKRNFKGCEIAKEYYDKILELL